MLSTLSILVLVCVVTTNAGPTRTNATLEIITSVIGAETKGSVPDYGNCGGAGKITNVEVSGCSTNPCFFDKGGTYTMAISFIPADPSNTLRYKAWFYDFEDAYEDFIDEAISGVVLPGVEYKVSYDRMFIPPSLAATRGFVQLQIWDVSFSHPVVCAEFEALVGTIAPV